MHRIAIIGAGFSGSILAVQLLRRLGPDRGADLHIDLIGKRGFARGLAYSTTSERHLLNVPAGKMSAFPAEPDHFLNWLQSHAESQGVAQIKPTSFIPRLIYGRYLEDLLVRVSREHPERIKTHREAAIAVGPGGDVLRINFASGKNLDADIVVLAPGNFPPADPPIADPAFYTSSFYRRDPWADGALDQIEPTAPVLLIGAALTTVDIAISLIERGHIGVIHAISRHGLLPRRHLEASAAPAIAPFELGALPASARGLLRAVRARIALESSRGVPWQSVIDGLRPITQELWRRAPTPERARFIRHLRPWWDVHRHRVAPEIGARIDAAQASGALVFHAGRIESYRIDGPMVVVEYRNRDSAELESSRVARVINCSGPSSDYRRIDDPLIQSMLSAGIVRTDPSRLGLEVTGDLRLVGADDAANPRLFALGSITKGAYWEIIAVPDLRAQCDALAERIVREIGQLVQSAPRHLT
ncbi:MAG: FAD/NAD(P)-binding protein [Candidatus Binataceae bacterium]